MKATFDFLTLEKTDALVIRNFYPNKQKVMVFSLLLGNLSQMKKLSYQIQGLIQRVLKTRIPI